MIRKSKFAVIGLVGIIASPAMADMAGAPEAITAATPVEALALPGVIAAAAPTDPAGEPQAAPEIASPFGGGAAVDGSELGTVVGQANLGQVVEAENNSEVSHNSVSGNSVTGTIAFDGSAFQNMNGLSLLSANTGNNVSINSSLNVNIAIHP